MKQNMIYLDNAATTFPKPRCTVDAVCNFLTHAGGNPGRAGHTLSVDAARMVYDTRESVAALFGGSDPLRVILTHNATYGINMGLKGSLEPGDRVITTSMEHNAVMRPLRSLEARGVSLTIVGCGPDGTLDPGDVERALREKADLVVMTAASNVTGTIMPVHEVGLLARERGVPFMVDAAQAGGAVPLNMREDCIDILAFTGHKSLYGPTGTGGVIFGERIEADTILPLFEGGTGSRSEEEFQPFFFPDRFESGTPNGAGIAGLGAALEWLEREGKDTILRREQALAAKLTEGLASVPGITLYGAEDAGKRTGVVSFTVDNIEVSEIGEILDDEFGIMTRVGLHCAPAAHKTIGTFPSGTVRMSAGAFTTPEDIDTALQAVCSIRGGSSTGSGRSGY